MSGSIGVIAAGHEATAQAGAEILRAGGNAYDAILGAVVAACAAEPVLSSLGGAGFLLAAPAEGKPQIYDFFAHTPGRSGKAEDIDFYPIQADFGGTLQEFHIGKAAIAVPGQIRGIFDIHREYGTMPIKEIFAPAIHLARKGVRVTPYQAYLFRVIQATYQASPECMKIYGSKIKDGEMVQDGEVLTNVAFADFLEVLASEGPDLFYRGEVAKILDRDLKDGGLVTADDLAGYEVVRRQPLELHYRDTYIEMNPPPASGGMLIAFGLKLMEDLHQHGFEPGSEEYLMHLAAVLDKTRQARVELEAESDHGKRGEMVLDEQFLARYRAGVMPHANSNRGTTHISVIDKDKNMASMTVSNGEGSGYVIPGTGIVMNNMLGEEDLNPGGFHKWTPATRLSSMMTPTTVVWSDGRRMALGSGGSNRIRTAILQLLVNMIDFNMPVEEAVNAPRIHLEDEKLFIEGGFKDEMKALAGNYSDVARFEDMNMFFGGTHVAGYDERGFDGAGDPRRSGVCIF